MAKLWTANKTWASDSPNANTEYLVGAANGGCNYQSIPQGGTKRILVSNGANGNVAYGNRSVPLPEDVGNVQFPTQYTYYGAFILFGNTGFRLYNSSSTRKVVWNNTNKRFDISQDYVPSTSSFNDFAIITTADDIEPSDLLNAVKQVKRFIFYKRVSSTTDDGQLKIARYITVTDSSQWRYYYVSGDGIRNSGVAIDSGYLSFTDGVTSPLGVNIATMPNFLLVPKAS